LYSLRIRTLPTPKAAALDAVREKAEQPLDRLDSSRRTGDT